jgi:prevent-host-death family protein
MAMETLTANDARRTLAAVMDRVTQERTPIAIARPQGGTVVLVALSQWTAIQEALRSNL